MKKYLIVLSLLIVSLSSCSLMYDPEKSVQAAAPEIVYTSTPAPTMTPIPSATVGYQDTAIVAQQTAMEAVRVNAGITAEFEQRLQEQLQITAAAEQRNYEVLAWTQTALPTIVSLTGTQQAAMNTQAAGVATFESSRMTATAAAPTLMVAIANSELQARHAQLNYFVGLLGMLGLAFFMLAAGFFLIKKTVTMRTADFLREDPQPEAEEEEKVLGTVVTLQRDQKLTRYVVPCSAEQLTELAEAITQGKKTLAINQWEGRETLFTRPVILQVRAWARENGFAVPAPDNQLAPTNEFFAFLIGWLERKELQEGFTFTESTPLPQEGERVEE